MLIRRRARAGRAAVAGRRVAARGVACAGVVDLDADVPGADGLRERVDGARVGLDEPLLPAVSNWE